LGLNQFRKWITRRFSFATFAQYVQFFSLSFAGVDFSAVWLCDWSVTVCGLWKLDRCC